MQNMLTEINGGEIYLWIEQESSIHIKAISGNDPVELTEAQATTLAQTLLKMVDLLQKSSNRDNKNQ